MQSSSELLVTKSVYLTEGRRHAHVISVKQKEFQVHQTTFIVMIITIKLLPSQLQWWSSSSAQQPFRFPFFSSHALRRRKPFWNWVQFQNLLCSQWTKISKEISLMPTGTTSQKKVVIDGPLRKPNYDTLLITINYITKQTPPHF